MFPPLKKGKTIPQQQQTFLCKKCGAWQRIRMLSTNKPQPRSFAIRQEQPFPFFWKSVTNIYVLPQGVSEVVLKASTPYIALTALIAQREKQDINHLNNN